MKRTFAIGLIVLGALLSIGAFSWLYFGNVAVNPTAITLPDQLAGLPKTDYRTGAQAVSEFENLHGKQFPLTSGAIGIYGDHQITVWAAATSSDSIASQMVDSMRDKIAEGNSPFAPLTQFRDNDHLVYVLEGMGQRHYYFQSKNLIIWLAADPSIADDALKQTLEAYP
jgi:hypothetical protein